MIDEKVLSRIEPELASDEEVLWASSPKKFVYGYFDIFAVAAIVTGVLLARTKGVDINSWGPWTVIAGLLFLHGFYPNFECYALTNKRIIIKRTWLLMASAYINRFDDMLVSTSRGLFCDIVVISKKSTSPSLWSMSEGSTMSLRLGFAERHWFHLYTSEETEHFYKLL